MDTLWPSLMYRPPLTQHRSYLGCGLWWVVETAVEGARQLRGSTARPEAPDEQTNIPPLGHAAVNLGETLWVAIQRNLVVVDGTKGCPELLRGLGDGVEVVRERTDLIAGGEVETGRRQRRKQR
jgi:hypothetical protein